MFSGTYTPKLDDKGRLFLPAKFRDEMGDGLVITRGQDRCLYVYDGPSWIYDSTGSCLPTRFIYPDHLNNVLERNSLGIDQVAEVHRIFAHNPPGVVVTADRPVTAQNKQSNAAVKQELDRAYRDLASVPYNGRTLILHVRKDDPVVTPPAEQP